MKKLFSFFTIALFFIVILAGFLRIYRLGEYPVGFHIDEASLGYNGYSMLKTGKDEHGKVLPLYIDMFGDNRPSGYHYLTIIPIAIFGLNEFATRLPGAFFGTITVIALFYLVLSLFKDKKLALLCSLLLAIAPWHVVSSRASAESVVALFFILVGFAYVVQSLQSKKYRHLIVGFCSLALSFQFYHTPRVFVPLLVLCLVGMLIKSRSSYRRTFVLTGITCVMALGLASFLLIFVIKGGTGRFSQVSIFGSPGTKLVMEEQFREDGTRNVVPKIARIFHNKIINYSLTFVSNYTDYFSGKFLFVEGGKPLWYKIPGMGMLYLIELPFVIIGFAYLLTQPNMLLKLPLIWLLLGPLVASITTDDIPNIQRVMVMLPMWEVIAGYGFFKAVSLFTGRKRKVFILLFSILFAYNFIYFLHQYFVHGSSHVTIYRFNGFKEMVLATQKEYNNFDTIIMTKASGGIYPHVLFFTKYDPATYQKEGSPKDPDFGGFGKFIFSPQICPSINGDDKLPKTGKILYIDGGTCKVSPLLKQKRIQREDGTTAFILVYPNE
jgi:4-amino-4-deoxy-L-arabinose transferase-like glycosyltransferase